MQIRNIQRVRDRTRVDSITGVGPASYATAAKPTLTLGNLRNIDSLDDVHIETDSLVYKAKPTLITGNVVTYLVCEGTAGADTEVIDTTVLNAVNFRVVGRGM